MKAGMFALLTLVLISFAPIVQPSFAYTIKCTTDFSATPTNQTVYTNETTPASISYSASVSSCAKRASSQLMSLSVSITSPSGTITTMMGLSPNSGMIKLNDTQLLQHGTWRLKLTWEYKVETTNGLIQFYYGHAKSTVTSKIGT